MTKEKSLDMEQFLDMIHLTEENVIHLVDKTWLTEHEKNDIKHIMIVPSLTDMNTEKPYMTIDEE